MVEYTSRRKSRQFDWLTELTNFTLVVEEEEAWEISLPAKKLLANSLQPTLHPHRVDVKY